MYKQDFLEQLRTRLSQFPKKEVEERLSFYAEMIEDRMEEGLSEEQAVAKMGSLESVALEIASEIPLMKAFKEKIKPRRRFKTWEIVLLAVGAPIWLSLLISAFAVLFSLYVSFWSVVASAWALFIALAAGCFGGGLGGLVFLFMGKVSAGIAFFAAALVCIGLTILFFFVGKWITRSAVSLAKKFRLGIKKQFIKRGEEK